MMKEAMTRDGEAEMSDAVERLKRGETVEMEDVSKVDLYNLHGEMSLEHDLKITWEIEDGVARVWVTGETKKVTEEEAARIHEAREEEKAKARKAARARTQAYDPRRPPRGSNACPECGGPAAVPGEPCDGCAF